MGRRTVLLVLSVLVAAVGVALVGLYVKGADARAASGTELVQVLVAREQIQSGTSGTSAALRFAALPRSAVPRDAMSLSDVTAAGMASTEVIYRDVPIVKGMFSKAGTSASPADATGNRRWIELLVGGGGVPTGTQPGSQVDLTAVDATDKSKMTSIPNVKVVRVGGQDTTAGSGNQASRVTVEVESDQATQLTKAIAANSTFIMALVTA